MKKVLAVFVFFLFAFNVYAQVLFRDKEEIEKQSKIFFKKIDLRLPGLLKADFYVKSGKYLPAYLCLNEFITKFAFLKDILPRFKEKNSHLVKEFNKHKIALKIKNYGDIRRQLKANRLKFFLLVLSSMYDDYANNILFGKDAYRQWNILLSIAEEVYKAKNKPAECTAILYVFSRFEFFKKCPKWQKKVEKNLKEIDHTALADEDTGLILSKLLK